MFEQGLFDYFITHHLPRSEVLNLLPFSVSIDAFWPELLRLRKERAIEVPQKGLNGQPLWFVMTDSLTASGDRVASMARRNIDRIGPGEDIMTDGLLDEAFFTSFVEGAPVSRLECRRFLKSGEDPSNAGEVLAQNNLSAIRHMADHRYEPFSEKSLLSVAQLLTSAMDAEAEDYRASDEHRIPGRAGAYSAVPPSSGIPGMMDDLFGFLNDYEMHPLLKAAIAHAYLLLVRPFDDGNERLARLFSYDILLRNGYSFFRQFSLSGMIAQDGILYYKAMDALQDIRSGGDITNFLEYYLGMLSRSVNGFDAYIVRKRREAEEEKNQASSSTPVQTTTLLINKKSDSRESEQEGKKAAQTAPKDSQKERAIMLERCNTPEMIVAFILKQQSVGLEIFDTKPYFSKLGLTEEIVLKALQEVHNDIAKRAIAMYRFLLKYPSRKFACSELAHSMSLLIGTTRRTCYILTTLNLIQATTGKVHGKQREMLCFYVEKELAA